MHLTSCHFHLQDHKGLVVYNYHQGSEELWAEDVGGTSVIKEVCRATTCIWYQPTSPAGFGGQARAMGSPRAWFCVAQGPILHGAQFGGSHGDKSKKNPTEVKLDFLS